MSGPFNVGDVVVCVEHDCCPECSNYPEEFPEMIGRVYRVAETFPPDEIGCLGFIGLEGDPAAWCVGTFRHLPKATEEFTAKIRACKPIRKGIPA